MMELDYVKLYKQLWHEDTLFDRKLEASLAARTTPLPPIVHGILCLPYFQIVAFFERQIFRRS